MAPQSGSSLPQSPPLVAAKGKLLVDILPAFKAADIPVTAVTSLAAARAIMARQPPSVLVTAVRLGDHNGLQLAMRGRMDPPGLPTIVIGEADPVTEAEVERMGAQFVAWPIAPSQLVCLVGRAMHIDAPPRRWRRICPERPLAARVGEESALIVDVGYGGLGLDLPGDLAERLPAVFQVRLDDYDITLSAERVWQKSIDNHSRCGALVALVSGSAGDALRTVVDRCRAAECRDRASSLGFSFLPPAPAAPPQET